MKREAAIPRERKEKQLSCPPVFRLYCRPARSALPPLAADTAMARARRRSRTPEGRTERRSRREHHPATGREGSRRRPTRHAADGVQPNSRDNFRVTAKRGVRGCRGESVSFLKGNTLTAAGADVRAQAQGKTALFPQCAGSATSDQGAGPRPLSPHAPRRAGDQLPAPGSSRKPRKKKEGKKKNCSPGSSRNAQKDTRLIRQGISTLKKEKREAAHSAASPPAAAFRAGNRLAPARNLG